MATSSNGRARRRYTDEQRERILRDAEMFGVCDAAHRHGVPESTVSKWRSTARAAGEEAGRGEEDPASELTPAEGRDDRTTEAGDGAGSGGTRGSPRVARRYTPSQRAEILEDADRDGVSAAAEKHEVSRFSIYSWLRQRRKSAAGEGPSPTSGESQSEMDARRDREILAEWKKHPGLGPSQVRNQLRRRGIKVAVQTVRRVMEDAGYRPPKVKREPHDKRYEAVRPNHLWHLDFVQRYINRASTFSLILIDDHSRFVVGHGVDDAERATMVIDTFEQAVRRHGKPEAVMHDKGAAFWSWRGISKFTALLTELGIDQIVAEKKEHNGKVENFNGNLHKELFDAHRFFDVAEMRRRLATHLHWFNHGRTHHALGGLLVPADRYYGRADEVLARIEAGAGRDLDGEIDLRDRCLEIFKVTSTSGVVEVWLMGRRVLEIPKKK